MSLWGATIQLPQSVSQAKGSVMLGTRSDSKFTCLMPHDLRCVHTQVLSLPALVHAIIAWHYSQTHF